MDTTLPETKVTKREHLRSLQKQTGKPVEELSAPPLPDVIAYLYQWFLELHRGRRYMQNGPLPLGWQDIQAYNELMGRRLKKWEVQTLKLLDQIWLNHVN